MQEVGTIIRFEMNTWLETVMSVGGPQPREETTVLGPGGSGRGKGQGSRSLERLESRIRLTGGFY